jgi:hypothetical protein
MAWNWGRVSRELHTGQRYSAISSLTLVLIVHYLLIAATSWQALVKLTSS